MDEQDARAALVKVMRRMHASGLNRGTSGNASLRVPGGMVVTPSGVPPDELEPVSMVFVDENGQVASNSLKPSSEYLMHHHILRSRPDANAVTHCHSRHATILACCGRAIEPLHYMILVAHTTRVDVAPYATFGTEALANAVVTTMGTGSACLLANHGQVTIGKTWQQALSIAEEIEEQAAVTYGALLLGGGNRLSETELADSVSQFASYGQSPAAAGTTHEPRRGARASRAVWGVRDRTPFAASRRSLRARVPESACHRPPTLSLTNEA